MQERMLITIAICDEREDRRRRRRMETTNKNEEI